VKAATGWVGWGRGGWRRERETFPPPEKKKRLPNKKGVPHLRNEKWGEEISLRRGRGGA